MIQEAYSGVIIAILFGLMGSTAVQADSMGALIAQKTAQTADAAGVPPARITTQTRISRAAPKRTPSTADNRYHNNDVRYRQAPSGLASHQYPRINRAPRVLPAFLAGSYDNVDSEYLPILGRAESQSSTAAREVIATARKMALNERAIIQGGCWDYLNAVFNRAGVSRGVIHKGEYKAGPYARSDEIKAGDWLYYINHGYHDVEHSGLFVGWVDEAAKQALILSYAGENRREPARYRVYDLSHVYQIMRPMA